MNSSLFSPQNAVNTQQIKLKWNAFQLIKIKGIEQEDQYFTNEIDDTKSFWLELNWF